MRERPLFREQPLLDVAAPLLVALSFALVLAGLAAVLELWVARLVGLLYRTKGDLTMCRNRFGTALEQPLAQKIRRATVVAVVGFDVFAKLVLAPLQPFFEHDDRLIAMPGLGRAPKTVKRLHFLEAVAVGRKRHRLPQDRVEIDEHLRAQQIVDFILS